jgi:hypothetical protein
MKKIRDPRRIPKILEQLKRTWKKYSYLRLGQLLYNAFYFKQQNFDNLFYTEDEKLIETIKEYDKKLQKDLKESKK